MRRSVWVVFAVGSIAALVVPFGCNDNEVEPETDFTISGTVTSVESGDPIEGVVVFVMERTTDTRSVAETNSDGISATLRTIMLPNITVLSLQMARFRSMNHLNRAQEWTRRVFTER
jgi:hypothetical protein